MITVRYRNFIINGTDMSGKEASVTQGEADKLARLGYAEIVSDTITIPAASWPHGVSKVTDVREVSEVPQRTKRGKRRGSKN